MISQNRRADGRFKSKGKGNPRPRQGGAAGGGAGVMIHGDRRSRPGASPHRSRQRHENIEESFEREHDDVDDLGAIDLAPSDKRFRSKVLASVGLDDDDDDDFGGEDVAEIESRHRREKSGGRRRDDDGADVELIEMCEEDGGISGEDGELLDDDTWDHESFDRSNESESSWLASVKRIIVRILWIMVAVAAIAYIFGEAEILEESEIDEEVVRKEPYSYNGYKDARIPDDDIAQYGGGIIGGEVFGMAEDETEDETGRDGSDPPESLDPPQNLHQGHHESTGVVQVDRLWDELDGYAEMAEPYDPDLELPVFWHVPKSGGTTLQDLMVHCVGMVGANEIGGKYAADAGSLEVVRLENGNRYVNVDMTSAEGISHARDFGFGQSGLADVVMTSRFDDAASVFDGDRKGRCFALLRHPIKRSISLFYYLKDATWEHTYREMYNNMTIEEYAASQYSEDNWMVRFLTNEMSGALFERHIDLAKQVLESKCLVGILEEFKPSFRRFNQYFGWNERDFGGPVKVSNRGTCVGRVIGNPDNAHSHPSHEEDSEVWNLLMEKNRYDLELYEHALHLFHNVQNKLVERP